jgi:ferrous iron transport protein B
LPANVRDVALGLWERSKIFLKRVGGIILSLTVILWFLSSFPGPPPGATGPAIDYSLAGRLGHALHYVFAPIGFNWQICIALVPGLAAREVAVSALGTVYAMSGGDDSIASQLGPLIAHQWSLATALSLLAWYVFAPQCMSTLAVIRRETTRGATSRSPPVICSAWPTSLRSSPTSWRVRSRERVRRRADGGAG